MKTLWLMLFFVISATLPLWAVGGWLPDSWRAYTARSDSHETNLVLAEFRNGDGQVKTWGVFRRVLPDGSKTVWVATGDLEGGVWHAGWVELSLGPGRIRQRASGQLRAVLSDFRAVASLSSDKPTDLLELSFLGPVRTASPAERELFSRCFGDFQDWSADF